MASYSITDALNVLINARAHLAEAMEYCDVLDDCKWHESAEHAIGKIADDIDLADRELLLVVSSMYDFEQKATEEWAAETVHRIIEEGSDACS